MRPALLAALSLAVMASAGAELSAQNEVAKPPATTAAQAAAAPEAQTPTPTTSTVPPTGTTAATAPGAPPAPPPLPPGDRVTFDVNVGADRGGGRATGSAGDFDYEDGRFLLASGVVELKYRDVRLRADRVRIDIPANRLTAEGNVVLDEGPRRLSGTTLDYDLTNRTGKITDAIAFVDPGYYFKGAEIAKIGPTTYTITDGTFTSCGQEVPSWSFQLSRAKVTMEEYARIYNARLKFKKLPVFYLPYMLWPATTERSSGFLVPKPGYSERRGPNLAMAYYKTLGRSADATFYADVSEEYNGVGTEFRWRPSEGTTGTLDAYYLMEPDGAFADDIFDPDRVSGDDRWKFLLFHDSKDLWNGFRGVVNIEKYSDFDYLKDIERSVDRQTRSFVYSSAFLTKNWGRSSFNVLIDERERILANRARDRRRQLPEVEYKLGSTQIGSLPLYFKLDSSMHYFSIDVSDPPPANPDTPRNTFSARYGRADVAPELSIPLSTLPWLSATIDLAGRVTHYTDSFNAAGTDFSGESLTRAFPVGAMEIKGPRLSKIYDSPGGTYSKFKHVIEPVASYVYVGDFDDQNRVSVFDEIDILRPVNYYAVGIVNRFLAKPTDETQGGAFEIASLEVGQAFNLDDQPGQTGSGGVSTTDGPIFTTLRLNPSRTTNLKADLTFNTLFSAMESFNISGETKFSHHALGLRWFKTWNAESGDVTGDQARVFLSIGLWPERVTLDAEVGYDFLTSELLNQRYVLGWQSECYSWHLELLEANYRDITEREVRFALTLKNVGTFLDLNDSF